MHNRDKVEEKNSETITIILYRSNDEWANEQNIR